MIKNELKTEGFGEIILESIYGIEEIIPFKNTILNSGRAAMIQSLAQQYTGSFENYINQMAFGNGGTSGGTPIYVDASITGLFPATLLTKPTINTVNPIIPTQVTFTSVLLFSDLVGQNINEMGLILANGIYYSVTTFGNISKTSGLQLTVNWRINCL